MPAAAQAETLSLSTSADPTQSKQLTITAQGTADGSHYLFVYVDTNGSGRPCAATPSDEGASSGVGPLTTYVHPAAGSFSVGDNYTPPTSSGYTVCGYLDTSSTATPDVKATNSFTARMPTGSVGISVGADPTLKQLTITVSGSTEVSRSLFVYIDTNGSGRPCGATPSDESGSTGVYQVPSYPPEAAAGSYSQNFNYTPQAAGGYTLCGYLDDSGVNTPSAVGTTSFTARLPHATINFAVQQSPVIGQPFGVVVSGSSELARRLQVTLTSGNSCRRTYDYSSPSAAVGPGNYSNASTFQIDSFGTYTLCAYIEGSDGSATTSLSIGPAVLLGPANGVSGAQLNPLFEWQGGANQTFALILSHIGANGKSSDFMRLQRDGYQDIRNSDPLTSDGLDQTTKLTPLTGVATFSVDPGGHGTAQMKDPLPPGHYEWRIRSIGPGGGPRTGDWIESAAQQFGVKGPRLTGLHVRAQTHRGAVSRYPGYTRLQIAATPYAEVSVTFSHQGRTGTITQHWGSGGSGHIDLSWTCTHPGGAYTYTVTARDDEGDHQSAKGRFRTVTAGHCRAMRAAELAAQHAADRARREAERRREQQAYNEQQARVNRFKDNCVALGGTPVLLDVGGQAQWFCRAPYGGNLYVPY